jgi:hypothetical protein
VTRKKSEKKMFFKSLMFSSLLALVASQQLRKFFFRARLSVDVVGIPGDVKFPLSPCDYIQINFALQSSSLCAANEALSARVMAPLTSELTPSPK